MARIARTILVSLLLIPATSLAQGGGGFSVPENPKPMSAQERVDELMRDQEFLIRLHELMHRIREAPNEAERSRLKAEQLRLLNTRIAPHAGPAAPQEEVQRLIEKTVKEPEPAK